MSDSTKTCPFCFSEIDERARKCPSCQSFQKGIYNPQMLAAILPIVIMVPFLYFTFSRLDVFSSDHDYENYVDQLRVEFVSISNDPKETKATYRIFNESEIKWERINYQVIGYGEGGSVITTVTDQERNWVVLPKSDALLTVKASNHPNVKEWKLKILDCREASRF